MYTFLSQWYLCLSSANIGEIFISKNGQYTKYTRNCQVTVLTLDKPSDIKIINAFPFTKCKGGRYKFDQCGFCKWIDWYSH